MLVKKTNTATPATRPYFLYTYIDPFEISSSDLPSFSRIKDVQVPITSCFIAHSLLPSSTHVLYSSAIKANGEFRPT